MPAASAPAKLNLALHITGKRADGYHELHSLVVFTDLADTLRAELADTLSLAVTGPFADASGDAEQNLVMRAARALQRATGCTKGAALVLEKNIPAGAGLGGGSADAAAALQLLSTLWGVKADLPAIAATLGADVALFLHAPSPLVMRGIGEIIAPLEMALPPLHAVLVYPNKPLSTVEVYKTYRHEERAPLDFALSSGEALLNGLAHTRNDLQRPAITLMPEVAEMLLALESFQPLLARMSGSGSCCFALVREKQDAQRIAAAIAARYPHWWVKAVTIL